jgi:hypothetical protein
VRQLRRPGQGRAVFCSSTADTFIDFPDTHMILLLLEALGALVLLVFIVWWTMFSGRKGGELPDHAEQDKAKKDASPPRD